MVEGGEMGAVRSHLCLRLLALASAGSSSMSKKAEEKRDGTDSRVKPSETARA